MKSQQSSREGDNPNILLQELSLYWLYWTIKGQDKSNDESVAIQSVLCEDALRVKRTVVVCEVFRYTDLRNKCWCLQKGSEQNSE